MIYATYDFYLLIKYRYRIDIAIFWQYRIDIVSNSKTNIVASRLTMDIRSTADHNNAHISRNEIIREIVRHVATKQTENIQRLVLTCH